MNKFIVIIRPDFLLFCQDACRAAAFNHLLFRIAGKSKDAPQEKIISGDILWYAKNEQIVEEMSNAWGLCKVRQEVNALIGMGLIGRKNNPAWGADRTKHFCFGEKECRKFLEYCEMHQLCVVHLELPNEVKHLIYSSNANDKSIKCICLNHQMETIDVSNANDRSIRAIPKDRPTIDDYKEPIQEESIPLSASAEESMPTENIRDFKTESAKLKAVSLHVASSDYQKEEDTGERERVIRPVLTIGGGGKQHDRNDLSGDWGSLPGAVHDKPGRGLSSPGGVGQTESAGGGQTETAPAHPLDVAQTPDAGTHSLAATPPGDGQDDGTRDQALLALPDAGQVASAPAASTALGVFSPTPTSGVQQGAAGHTPPKPRLKKTVIVKDTAGPPPFPSESDAWGTTTCLRLFDFWRGAPLCDLGQLKYASSCAKRLAETYSRVQVVLVRTAMNNQTFWKEQGGADVCDVARHMSKELNKLKMPAPPEQPVDIYTQASLDPERNQRNIDRLRAKTAARLQQASGE